MKPTVSVCVPTYNGEKYLEDCLNSLLAQTFSDFEILIVDDCSSDRTVSIVERYAERDRRIKLVKNQQNLGLVGNWNRCLEIAQGEWIKFVFQDDLIAPECLEKMLSYSNPEIGIVCCRRDFIFEPGTPEHLQQFYRTILSLENLFPKTTEISASQYCQAVLDRINPLPYNFVGEPTCVMLHQNLFDQFGVFNRHLIQICDFEFWTRIAVNRGTIYVPEILASFRLHGKSTSSQNHANSQYRINILDPLIVLHDFALHPIYAPLRAVAAEHGCRDGDGDLLNSLAKKARKAWTKAMIHSDRSLLTEWNKTVNSYPRLASFGQPSFIELVAEYSRSSLGSLKQKLRSR